jgi:hypothetical protein
MTAPRETLRPLRWGSLPVPISAMWEGDVAARSARVVRWPPDPGMLYFSAGGHAPGVGRPMFKVLHEDRCRALLSLDLCQMCGEALGPSRVCVGTGSRRGVLPLVSDGLPMHAPCARVACEACPGLQRREATRTLHLYRVDGSLQNGALRPAPRLLAAISPAQGGMEDVNALIRKHGVVVAGPDVVLTRFMRIQLADLPTDRGFDA